MNRKAFTLIELMIILVVIGILVAVGLPRFTSFIDEGRRSAADQQMSSIISAVKMFEMHMRQVPTCVKHLVVKPPAADYGKASGWSHVEVWKGPYMEGKPEEIAMDPWGHPFIIYYNIDAGGANNGYILYSYGSDGTKDEADEAKPDDIVKWLRYDGPNADMAPADGSKHYRGFDGVPDATLDVDDPGAA